MRRLPKKPESQESCKWSCGLLLKNYAINRTFVICSKLKCLRTLEKFCPNRKMGWLTVNVSHQQIQVPREQKNDLKEPRNLKVQNLVHSVGCSEGHRINGYGI